MNTFGMKVSCGRFVEYDSLEDLFSLDFDELPKPLFHMGAGSNLLFTGDWPGTVLHSGIKFLRPMGVEEDEVLVEVGAGAVFDSFVEWACSRGLWGLENLSLIPGEVGASARVECIDLKTGEKVVFDNGDCRYGYRSSFFKEEGKGRYIVTSVLFRLSRKYSPKLDYGNIRAALGDGPVGTPDDVRRAVIGIRNAKLPDPAVTGSAGSFFKNPVIPREHFERIEAEAGPDVKVPHYDTPEGVKVPAAWMIERCGLKGLTLGGAAVYEKQPLVIVNLSGNASPEEIVSLENQVIAAVMEKFGVELHPEVEHL